jgi:purine-binding chemotaxis protein CheW
MGAVLIDGASGLSLMVRVSGRLCALALRHVIETMRALPVESFSGAPPFVRGVAVVRGVPTPVVEAAWLLGEGGGGPGARWVTMDAGGRPVALAVDEVLGVRSLPADDRVSLPPLLRDAGSEVVAALGRLDAELLLILQASRAWTDEAWHALEAAGVSAT